MIPANVAKALHTIMTMADWPEGYSPGVRLISDDGDTLVFAETLTKFSCMQVMFDSVPMEKGDWDVVIPGSELEEFVRRSTDPDYVDFEDYEWPSNVEEALEEVLCGGDPPDGVSFWERSGMQLMYLADIVSALQEIYGKNIGVKISQKDYTGGIKFHVPLDDDAGVETTIVISAYLMWDGEGG